ncbi:OST-HTH/LOTUS domain protein [compost metagenome]
MREAGKKVYGLGERKTPEAFIGACDKFIFFEVLKKPAQDEAPLAMDNLPDLREILTQAIEEKARDHGWAPLGAVGSYISKNHTSFDARNYGFAKLGALVRAQDYIEIKEVPDGEITHIHVRLNNQ